MPRRDQRKWAARLARSSAAALLVLLAVSNSGCVTTEILSSSSADRGSHVPESVAKRDLGIDYLASHRTAMAIRELRASLKLDSSDPATNLWIGEAYRRKGKTDEAESFLRRAIELSDSDAATETRQSALLNLSALLSQMGRYEESLPYCHELANDPTFSSPWRPLTNCGWSLYQLGRLDEAASQYVEALDYFPRFGPALLNLGILRSKQGKKLAAINALELALESGRLQASAIGEANFRLGEIYVGLGRRDKAIVHFREAAEIAPFDAWGSQSQAYLDLLH